MGSKPRLSFGLTRRMTKDITKHFSEEILLPKAKHRLSGPDTRSTKQHVHYSRQDTAFPLAVWNTNRDNRKEFVPR